MIVDPEDLSDAELDRRTKISAERFFSFNGGKNTPNILIGLSGNIEGTGKALEENTQAMRAEMAALRATIKESSDSSSRLATALNRITVFYAIITLLGVGVAGFQAWTSWQSSKNQEPNKSSRTNGH